VVSTRSEQLYEEFGRRVRAIRRRAGVTQGELAQQLGLSRTSVSNIEAGRQRLPLHHLYAFAAALDCELLELIPERRSRPYEEALRRMDKRSRDLVDEFLEGLKEDTVAGATA